MNIQFQGMTQFVAKTKKEANRAVTDFLLENPIAIGNSAQAEGDKFMSQVLDGEEAENVLGFFGLSAPEKMATNDDFADWLTEKLSIKLKTHSKDANKALGDIVFQQWRLLGASNKIKRIDV